MSTARMSDVADAEDAAATQVVQDTNFALATSDHTSTPSDGNYDSASTSASAAVATKSTTTSSRASRALAPDLLRGLILPLMSLDHAALFLGAWLHGTPKQSESAGTVFTRWNFTTAYISRTITHLCAPGFFFLMGMGCVYFHRSRVRIGWSSGRMTRHFVVRAVALTLVSEVMGETLMWGRHILVINIVLIGLAVDYLLTGLLCLGVDRTEAALAKWLDQWLRTEPKHGNRAETRPLLSTGGGEEPCSITPSTRSHSTSFWLHNALLLLLSYISIFWNVWLSPTGGRCASTSLEPSWLPHHQVPIDLLALVDTSTDQPRVAPSSHLGPWFDFWFYPVQNSYVMSGFPPLAWLSFCVFGMLYARVMLHKRWTPKAVAAWNLSVAVVLAALFVSTRLLHFGNLSEDCLRIGGQQVPDGANQYLISVKSFFYITKYPPSPSFFFLTMSINFALLAVFSAMPPSMASFLPGLPNYGGSALFFYVAHMYLYFLLAVPVRYLFEHDLPDKPPNEWEQTKGLGNTPPFWITWILGLLILSPMCRAYGAFKAKQPEDSIWRFF